MKNDIFDSKIVSDEERLNLNSITEIKNSIQYNLLSQAISKLTHELNQSLTVIQTYVGGCIRQLQDKNSMDEVVTIMQKVAKCTELLGSKINAMPNLLFQEQLIQENSDIHSIVKEVTLMLSHKINQAKIAIDFDFSHNLPQRTINRSRIVLVLFSLIQFSIEAVKNQKVKKPRFEIQTEKTKEDSIIITIRNNIPLFTPKFATRQNELELKLALYRAVLEIEGGTLTMRSLENSSWFQIILYHKNDC